MFVWQYCQYGWELRGALVYPCKVVKGALCGPLCMGWLEWGSGGPGQLHSPMSTGEDWHLPIEGTIFGTIKDVAVAPKMREYRGQNLVNK